MASPKGGRNRGVLLYIHSMLVILLDGQLYLVLGHCFVAHFWVVSLHMLNSRAMLDVDVLCVFGFRATSWDSGGVCLLCCIYVAGLS